MSDPVPTADPDTTDLTALAATANRENRAANEAALSALDHARAAGQALIEAKAALPYGAWTGWLEANFDATTQTARNYMRIARRWSELEAPGKNENAFSIRKALDALARDEDNGDEDDGDGTDPGPDDSDDGPDDPTGDDDPDPRPRERREAVRAIDRVVRAGQQLEAALAGLRRFGARVDSGEWLCVRDFGRVSDTLADVKGAVTEAEEYEWRFGLEDLPYWWEPPNATSPDPTALCQPQTPPTESSSGR